MGNLATTHLSLYCGGAFSGASAYQPGGGTGRATYARPVSILSKSSVLTIFDSSVYIFATSCWPSPNRWGLGGRKERLTTALSYKRSCYETSITRARMIDGIKLHLQYAGKSVIVALFGLFPQASGPRCDLKAVFSFAFFFLFGRIRKMCMS